MNWLKGLFGVSAEAQRHFDQEDTLINEIREAHRDWVIAQQKLNYAQDEDQIDYAIYVMEAAEKRYNMLIRQAKKQHLNMVECNEELAQVPGKTFDV